MSAPLFDSTLVNRSELLLLTRVGEATFTSWDKAERLKGTFILTPGGERQYKLDKFIARIDEIAEEDGETYYESK